MPKINKPSNSLTVAGTLVEHSLVVKESQNGRLFIRGQVVIDTSTVEGVSNEVKINVLQFADKKDKQDRTKMIPDSRYDDVLALVDAIGTDVRISASFDNSVFVQNGETRKGSQISGGFYSRSGVGTKDAKFKVTVVIKSIEDETVRDSDGDQVPTGNLVVDCRVFNYNGTNWIPKKFIVDKDNAPALKYFRGELDQKIEEGDVTELWGKLVDKTTKRIVKSAFGEPTEEEGPTRLVPIITGARQTPYDLDEDLEAQLNAMRQAYNTYVDSQVERDRLYQESKQNQSGAGTQSAQNTETKKGQFNF